MLLLNFFSNKSGEKTCLIVIGNKRMSKGSFYQMQGGNGYGK